MANLPALQDWEQYPLCFSQDQYVGLDLQGQHEELIRATPRIFSGQGEIEMWTQREDSQETITQSVFDPDNVEQTSGCRIYFIHQANSWAPIQTSADTLKKLLTAHAVCPVFLDALFSFGAKVTGDDDPYFNICHQQDNDTGFEFCYLLRSYEKHNRPTLKNPWSLRQMAIYHKYNRQTATSVWIFIQPFKRCKPALWKELSKTRCASPNLYVHALLISLALHDWRPYLNDRRQFISQFTEKATHSSLCPKPCDYETGFNDCQRLQSAKDSLSLAHGILQSTLQTTLMIQQTSNISVLPSESESIATSNPIRMDRQIIERIHGFIRTAHALQEVAEGTLKLLSKLLEYRKTDVLSGLAQTLTVLGSEANAQTDHLRSLAEESKGEARSMSVLTLIATVYIPASLLASIFSSGLVQFPNRVNTEDIKILSVQTAIWVYVVSSLMLSGITIAGAYFWVGHSRGFGLPKILIPTHI